MAYQTPAIQAALASPMTSFWLKRAINDLLDRDAVDAVDDAEQLAKLFSERLDDIQADEATEQRIRDGSEDR